MKREWHSGSKVGSVSPTPHLERQPSPAFLGRTPYPPNPQLPPLTGSAYNPKSANL